MRRFLAAFVTILLATAACAQSASKANSGSDVADRPITRFPYTPGLNVVSMDKNADPCADFYQYSCGGWMKSNPIPPDQAGWDVYAKLAQDNQQFLWGILDEVAKSTGARNANQQKIGDYFAACMDESAVEKLGAAPLKADLDQITAMTSKQQLPAVLAGIIYRRRAMATFLDLAHARILGTQPR